MADFKSYEKYMLVDGNWQLVSERTLAKDVLLDNGSDLPTELDSKLSKNAFSYDEETNTLTLTL